MGLGDGQHEILVNAKFGNFSRVIRRSASRATLHAFQPTLGGPNADVRSLDVNGDGCEDLVSSYGHVLLRDAQGKLPTEPSLKLPTPSARDWSCLGVGDFNGDGRPDIGSLGNTKTGVGAGGPLALQKADPHAPRKPPK